MTNDKGLTISILVMLFITALAGGFLLSAVFFKLFGTQASDYPRAVDVQKTVYATAMAPLIGNPAPEFSIPNLAGEVVSLSDYKGQPIIINFWATWCGPCEAEMPDINEVYLAHQEAGLVVLAVNLLEHPETISSFVDYYELAFTILLDRDETVGTLYQVRGLPSTFFIDEAGNIAHIHLGQMRKGDLERGVKMIMED